MRAVIQRVTRATVHVGDEVVGQVGPGLLVLLGVAREDTEHDARLVAGKLTSLRIFADEQGKMNRAIGEIGGGILLVSQFTLLGDTQKGRRPGFDKAAPPEAARRLYELVGEEIAASGVPVQTGRFGAAMQVELVNDGPVTLLVDSREGSERQG